MWTESQLEKSSFFMFYLIFSSYTQWKYWNLTAICKSILIKRFSSSDEQNLMNVRRYLSLNIDGITFARNVCCSLTIIGGHHWLNFPVIVSRCSLVWRWRQLQSERKVLLSNTKINEKKALLDETNLNMLNKR